MIAPTIGANMISGVEMNVVFSRVLRDSTPSFVGLSVSPLVRPSVRPSDTLYFFVVFFFLQYLASLLLPK